MTLLVIEPCDGARALWRISFFAKDTEGLRLCSTVEAPWTETLAIVKNFGAYVASVASSTQRSALDP
jgi:hypothetical protein